MKKYIRANQFDDFGHALDPNDKRTNYRFSDKYIPGNDASPEELYEEVLLGYVTDRGELETIKEILQLNHWDDQAKIVQYFIDEIDEEKQYGNNYNISRMKIDIAQGYKNAGFKDVGWGEVNWGLDCYVDGDYVIIILTDPETWVSDGDRVPISEFMNMTRDDFDTWVGQLRFYGNFESEDEE